MKFYFIDKQVPELSALGSLQRQLARDGAVELFCKDHPAARWQLRLANGLTTLFPMIFALSIGRAISPHHWLAPFLVGMTAIYVIQLFYQSALTERLRPYFLRYIEGHKDAISRAA